MSASLPAVERLLPPANDDDVRGLARLLSEAVADGAVVSFLAPFPVEHAELWWRRTLAAAHENAVFLVARDAGEIVGTVQLHPAWAPNQPHRADVVKLLVAPPHRGAGLGTRLMRAIEDAARERGLSLLTLDAKRGAAAERLYRRLGWTHVGTIPDFALDPNGATFHDAVLFYKVLGSPDSAPVA